MKKVTFVLLMILACAPLHAEIKREYKVIILRLFNTTEPKQTEKLNEMAAEGWRLVTATQDSANNTVLYLERLTETK